ncbi:MAG: sn-glycerol-1-phosphate dehydrogenase [Myxococcota bacterium]
MQLAPASPQLHRLLADNRASGRSGVTREVRLGAQAVHAVGPWFASNWPGQDALVLSDDHTFAAAGEAVEGVLAAAGVTARRLVLEPRPGDDHLIAEDGIVRAVETLLAASPNTIVVAVGAGTVNDIGKYASFKLKREYVAVPTAASMNGYTSTIAALLVGGVKRTLPCDQPVAIFADTGVLAAAPRHLNQAGFGDLLSKPVSQADWLLSHIVRGVPYSTRPNDILEELFAELLTEAGAIGRADLHGLQVLMEAILVSGFSMAVAGSSAPASGGEHLVSHYWDMEQLCAGQPLLGLHGTQVGVATRLSAMLFERLLTIDPEAIDPVALAARKPDAGWLDAVATRHPALTPAVIGEVRTQLAKKQKLGAELAEELALVKARWPEIKERLAAVMLPVATIEKALDEAGCVAKASDLGCDFARLVHTLEVCRDIRDRYVGLDLMDDLGQLAGPDGWATAAARRTESVVVHADAGGRA